MAGLYIIYRSASKVVPSESSSNKMHGNVLQPFLTTKKGTEGTGQGLSITHDIVKAHGGSMGVQSEPGKTVFIINIPNGKSDV